MEWINADESLPEKAGVYFIYGKVRGKWKLFSASFHGAKNGSKFSKAKHRVIKYWLKDLVLPTPPIIQQKQFKP